MIEPKYLKNSVTNLPNLIFFIHSFLLWIILFLFTIVDLFYTRNQKL